MVRPKTATAAGTKKHASQGKRSAANAQEPAMKKGVATSMDNSKYIVVAMRLRYRWPTGSLS